MFAQKREALLAEFQRWGFDEKGWLPGTRDKYARDVRAADRWLRENRDTTVVLATVRDLKAYLFSRSPNARTRNRTRQALVAFGAFLVDGDVLEFNGALELPRLPEPELLPRPLTEKQAKAVLAAARASGIMIETLVTILAYSGMRRNELRTLSWHNITLDGNEGWFRFVGKRQKERVVPIETEALVSVLKRWRAICDDPRWVFPSDRRPGQPISETWVRKSLNDVGDIAGILRTQGPDGRWHGLHPHQLRHTFATSLSDRGVALEVIQELLGHADPKTTRIYTKVRRPRLRGAIKTLDFEHV